MCDPRQARDHHAQGHPAAQLARRIRAELSRLEGQIICVPWYVHPWPCWRFKRLCKKVLSEKLRNLSAPCVSRTAARLQDHWAHIPARAENMLRSDETNRDWQAALPSFSASIFRTAPYLGLGGPAAQEPRLVGGMSVPTAALPLPTQASLCTRDCTAPCPRTHAQLVTTGPERRCRCRA